MTNKKRVPRKKPTSEQALEKCPAEVVLEKHGKLVLSEKEYREIQKGTVPDRVKEGWDVNLAEAREMLQCSFYEVVKQDKVASSSRDSDVENGALKKKN